MNDKSKTHNKIIFNYKKAVEEDIVILNDMLGVRKDNNAVFTLIESIKTIKQDILNILSNSRGDQNPICLKPMVERSRLLIMDQFKLSRIFYQLESAQLKVIRKISSLGGDDQIFAKRMDLITKMQSSLVEQIKRMVDTKKILPIQA